MNPSRIRPIGVTLIAVAFLWIGFGGTLLYSLVMLSGGNDLLWRWELESTIHSSALLKIFSTTLDIVLYLMYITYAIIGVGLWKLKNWARISVLCIAMIGLVGAFLVGPILRMSLLMSASIIGISAVEFGWIGWYFLRPAVQNAFGAWKRYTPDGKWIQPPLLSTRARLLAGAVIASLLLILFAIPLSSQIIQDMKRSDAYKLTMRTAEVSPCVLSALGSPLQPGWMLSGNITESATHGSADLSIPVNGPKGKGTLEVQATKFDGRWKIESLVLDHGSSRSIMVPSTSAGPCR